MIVSNGFVPGCVDANEMWPGVCQSWVMTSFATALAIRYTTGTALLPSFTGRLPPGRKQFWTWTTISTLLSSGEILVAANTGVIRPTGVPASPTLQSPDTNRRRLILVMIASRLRFRLSSGEQVQPRGTRALLAPSPG